MVKKSFERDTFFYGIAIMADRLVGFFILPLLTRGLSQTDFGVWSQIQTVYGFLSTALLLGFYHTVSSLVANRNATEIKYIFKGILLIVLITSLAFALISLLFRGVMSLALFADKSYSGLIPVIVWFAVTEALFELVVLAYLRAKHSIPHCALFLIVKSALRFVAVWYGLHEHSPLTTILDIIGFANVCIVAYALKRYIFVSTPTHTSELNLHFWQSAMFKSISIAMAVFMAWGCLAANRFLIVHFLGLHSVAIYSANYSLFSITTFVPMILTFTLLHHLSVLMAKKDVSGASMLFNQAINYYLYITLPILILIVLFYPALMHWIAPGYSVGWNLQFCFTLYFFLFGLEQLFIFSIFAQANPKAFVVRMFAFLISVISGFVLIPRYGFEFSVWPLCAVSIMIICWCSSELRKTINANPDWKTRIQILLSATVMATIGLAIVREVKIEGVFGTLAAIIGISAIYLIIEALRSNSLTLSMIRTALGWRRHER